LVRLLVITPLPYRYGAMTSLNLRHVVG